MGLIAVPSGRLQTAFNPAVPVKLNPASWFAQQQTARVWHSNSSVGLTDLSPNQNHAITQGYGIGKQPSQFGSGVYGDVSANSIPELSGYSTPVGAAMLTGASAITMWGVVCFSDLSQSSETDLMRAEIFGSGSYQYAFDFFPATGVFRPLCTTSGTNGFSTGNDVTVSGLKTGELYLMLTRWQSGQVFETLVQPVGSALAGYLSNTLVPTGTITTNGATPTNIGGIGYNGAIIYTFPGWIYLAGVVGEYMPDGAVAELLRDPFNYTLRPAYRLFPLPTAGGGTGFAQAVSSTLTLGGTYGRAIARAVAASATPQATTAKATARALTGSATPQTTAAKATARTVTGSIASTGTETEQAGIGMVVTATITAGATLARAFSRGLTGVLSFAGATLRNTGRALAASISSTGTETEQAGIGLAVAGSIAMAAVVSTARQFTLALSAAIALGGAVARGAGRAVSGTLSATANVSRATGRTLAGVRTATGTILRNLGTSLAVAGSIALGAVVSAVKGIASLTRSVMALLGVGN